MSLLEYFKNIEYHVPNNTDDETSNSIKKYQVRKSSQADMRISMVKNPNGSTE